MSSAARRLLLATTGSAVVAGLLLIAAPLHAVAAPVAYASISGRVSLPDGIEPGSGYTTVYAYRVEDTQPTDYVAAAVVSSNQTYALTGLYAGTYKIRFAPYRYEPGTYNQAVAAEWWNDATSYAQAVPVTITERERRTDVDVTLSRVSSIRGTVSYPEGQVAGDGDTVAVLTDAETGAEVRRFGATMDGVYIFGQLQPGTYRLCFETQVVSVRGLCWTDAADTGTATTITLDFGEQLSAIDVALTSHVPTPPQELAAVSPTPVYRFWSDRFQGHFYTADPVERERVNKTWPDVWKDEGAQYMAFTTQAPGTVPLYRFWSDRYHGHFYTADQAERDHVITTWPDVWSYEGVAYYVYPADSNAPDTLPMYRFWGPNVLHHFYTASNAERDKVIGTWPNVWSYEGARFRVPAGGMVADPTPARPADKNCTDFATWAQAQAFFGAYYAYYGDFAKLDSDGDLIACETLRGAP